ncbi:MAG: hypothetical protein PVH61_01080 [Candidatus Aminicenantes bacterium]|jgi:hypothetical protein
MNHTGRKCRKASLPYNTLEFVNAPGIEAFNLLFNLFTLNEPKAVMVCIDSFKLQIMSAFNQKLLRGVQGGGFLEKSPPGRRRQ